MKESWYPILYLSICSQINFYSNLLEEDLDEENRNMSNYILKESLDIEQYLRSNIDNIETTIERPKW